MAAEIIYLHYQLHLFHRFLFCLFSFLLAAVVALPVDDVSKFLHGKSLEAFFSALLSEESKAALAGKFPTAQELADVFTELDLHPNATEFEQWGLNFLKHHPAVMDGHGAVFKHNAATITGYTNFQLTKFW